MKSVLCVSVAAAQPRLTAPLPTPSVRANSQFGHMVRGKGRWPVSETPDPERLKDLSARIEAAQSARAPEPPKETKYEKANMAWQMVIELVAGMVIGLMIGWSLDWLFGTLPVFLMIFGLLGFAAGVKTMIGTAKGLSTPPGRRQQDDPDRGPD